MDYKKSVGRSFLVVVLSLSAFTTSNAHFQAPPKTEKQKKHGKLFKNYGARKITELRPARDLNFNVEVEEILQFDPRTTEERIRAMVCSSDLVALVTLGEGVSALTEDETFLFTDYQATVNVILKTSTAVRDEDRITITRPGGAILLGGARITASLDAFPPFREGSRYLVFLKFLPDTGSYEAFGSKSFELRGKRYVSLGKSSPVDTRNMDADSFVEEVRGASVRPCS